MSGLLDGKQLKDGSVSSKKLNASVYTDISDQLLQDGFLNDDSRYVTLSDDQEITGTKAMSDIYPRANRLFNVGSETNRWDTLYAENGNFSGGVNVGGTVNGASIKSDGSNREYLTGDGGYRSLPIVTLTREAFEEMETKDPDTYYCILEDIIRPLILELTVEAGDVAGLPIGDISDCTIDWGDGTIDEGINEDAPTHTYVNGGTYTVSITGVIKRMDTYLLDYKSNQRNLITAVISWGANLGLESMRGAFLASTKLTSIPADTYGAFKKVTKFSNCFAACIGLTSLPEDLFLNCPNVTEFSDCFIECSGLTSLPEVLFSNSPNVTSFGYCFSGCTGLTSVPEGLFSNCPNVSGFVSCFSGCTGLTSVPEILFSNSPNVTDFRFCFSKCSGLTSIPEGLFSNCPNVTNFWGCFDGCTGLTSVPEDLFSNCPNVTSFEGCFSGGSSLSSVPEGLFSNCPNVTNFWGCFSGCSSLTVETPKDNDGGELWERQGKAGYPATIVGTECFRNALLLSNYESIPSDWK